MAFEFSFRRTVITTAVCSTLLFCSATGVAADSEPHEGLTWNGPGTCLECHTEEATEVHASVMYQWSGESPQMTTGPTLQGKAAGGVNSYCINILGNWEVCGNCHIGLGSMPKDEVTEAELEHIDCLPCHQQAYRRKKVTGVFVPDLDAMAMTMDEATQTVHQPMRSNCLQCHAKAGGGDAVKRGDLALASADTADVQYDVHMSVSAGDLNLDSCQQHAGMTVFSSYIIKILCIICI